MLIRIAGLERNSIVDGEGLRYVIFTQGCKHHCVGCQNPETWEFTGGEVIDTDKLLSEIKEDPIIDGVTLSGGDPFFQAKNLIPFVKQVKELGLNVWAYTGFEFEQFLCFIHNKKCSSKITSDMIKLLNYIDVVVDGPFMIEKKTLEIMFRGSSNQRLIDVKETLLHNKIIEYNIEE